MASPNTVQDLKALRRLVNQADLVLATIPDPHPSVTSARESLNAALALAKVLAKREPDAAALGAKGGNATKAANLARDPDYYKRIAGMRKVRGGGRPKKSTDG
ncbi:MAG: hypothetical protein M3Y72_11605 [Acidobacteriota bacterium]|nr:hypothetical protein [Acidobacteriota bacterium]